MTSMSVSYEPTSTQREIYSVSRLNREARMLLNISFPLLWVEGEISNLATPASGHLYFTLKDDAAGVRCAMFKNQNLFLRFKARDGMQVLLRARVSLYEPRGDFQLAVEHMEEAGFGVLQRAYEALKQRLAAKGLFDPARKRALHKFPNKLGIITSPQGAAIRDILSVLRQRLPTLPVLIYPVAVQGEGAAAAIAEAFALANRRGDCDVLILARGGGSLEDLWAFNTEVVARAIAACEIPVVSGVGHEIDFTIADFTADHRAATPTAAAALVTPDRIELLSHLRRLEQNLEHGLRRQYQRYGQTLDWLSQRLHLQHPQQRLQRQLQRADDLDQRLQLAMRYTIRAWHAQLSELGIRRQRCSPQIKLAQAAARTKLLGQRLAATMQQDLALRRRRLDRLASTLDAISPLATLNRGYALVTRTADGVLLRDSKNTTAGDRLAVRLARGELTAQVITSNEPERNTNNGTQ